MSAFETTALLLVARFLTCSPRLPYLHLKKITTAIQSCRGKTSAKNSLSNSLQICRGCPANRSDEWAKINKILYCHKCHNTALSTRTQTLLPWQDNSASKPLEGKTACHKLRFEQVLVGVWITLPKNRLSRQPAIASSVGRFSLFSVHKLALASQGCRSGRKQLWGLCGTFEQGIPSNL